MTIPNKISQQDDTEQFRWFCEKFHVRNFSVDAQPMLEVYGLGDRPPQYYAPQRQDVVKLEIPLVTLRRIIWLTEMFEIPEHSNPAIKEALDNYLFLREMCR